MKKIFFIALLFTLWGCSADFMEAPEAGNSLYDPDTQLVLDVLLPRSIGEAATRAEQDPTTDECNVTSLRMIAFAESGYVENRALPVPSAMPVAPDASSPIQIKHVASGNYRIYVVANMPETALTDIRSEQELKDVVLDYSSSLPEAGALPMIYEPGASTFVPAEGTPTPTVHTLSLKFTCVKLRYNLVFSKDSETQAVFGDKGLMLKKVTAERVSGKSWLVMRNQLAESRSLQLEGDYYDNWDDVPTNASQSNADVITARGARLERPSDPTSNWLWQGTVYLPERNAATADSQTRLVIEAFVTDASGAEGNVRCKYLLPLGGYVDNPDARDLPRNTYYEVIGRIKTLGEAELDATVVTKDWMQQNLPADCVHTYLQLSKTHLSVNSLQNDELVYSTDGRGGIEFKCETQLPVAASNGKPALVMTHDQASGKVVVSVNPEVDIIALPREQRVGTANCYVKAGNIRKYFKVDYDIAPFFTVEPVALKIQYTTASAELNKKVFEYRTNLGGILLTRDGQSQQLLKNGNQTTEISVNGKRISVQCPNPNAAVGTITVTALENPGTTTLFELDAFPLRYSEMSESMRNELPNKAKEDLSVTVMPPLGGYRIYFRAINDYHCGYEGSERTTGFLTKYDGTKVAFPTEGMKNWVDFWDNYNSGHSESNIDNVHRVYIYTQFGETVGTEINGPVWEFTQNYSGHGGNAMKGDINNPGWYYYDLPANQAPIFKNNLTASYGSAYDIPRPGETLMIFTDGYDLSKGYTLHRASHHLDPGISLFDYEDREGYVVYDPTCEPYFFVFDDKPLIEDVVFTVYADKKILGWYNRYGNASNSNSKDAPRYRLHDYDVACSTQTIAGKTWYKIDIKLKCPRGEYAKALSVATGTRRVYFGSYGGDLGSYGVPKIYFYKKGGATADWNNCPSMKVLEGTGGKVYYYDVPDAYDRVIFRSQNLSQQYPGANQDGLLIDAPRLILYSDSKSWMEYVDPTADFKLFNGREFPGNKGYLNTSTKKWSQTPN